MSKIIRSFTQSGSILIGEQQRDKEAEVLAEQMLSTLFPMVSYVTSVDGARLIPVVEVPKMSAVVKTSSERSYREGYEQGYQAGIAVGQEQAQRVMKTFEQAVNDTINHRSKLLNEAKEQILELIVAISRKVTYDAVHIDRDATAEMVARIIGELADRSKIIIKVHPDFLPVIEAHRNRLLQDSTTIKDLRFEADARVRHGGCLIETPTGDIDARLEQQFQVIEQVLTADADRAI